MSMLLGASRRLALHSSSSSLLLRSALLRSFSTAFREERDSFGTKIPYILSARNAFSTSAPSNPSPKVPPSNAEKKSGGGGGGSLGGLLVGGVLLGGGALAYNYGYFDSFLKDAKTPVHDAVDKNTQRVSDEKTDLSELKSEKPIPLEGVGPNVEKPAQSETVTTEAVQSAPTRSAERETVIPEPELRPVVPSDESISTKEGVREEVMQDKAVVPDVKPVQPESVTQDTESKNPEEVLGNMADGGEFEKNEQIADEPIAISRKVEEAGASDDIPPEDTANQMQKDSVDTETQPLKSLAELYSLEEDNLEDTAKENIESANVTSSGNYDEKKVVVDVVEAIRTAERQQAEADAYVFAEEKRRLKEKYERELKDARALLVKKAEEVAMLERELNKEKAKAVATIKGLQERAQQKLQEELQQKEEEARKQLERVQELAKAELAAAISMEKASQIEKIAEAELNINALCMAFYARSEEARQSHSVHNLALATLRMEDALSEGLPLRGEVDSLRKSLEGIDKDTLLSLALSSLPEEALDYGTDNPMDLSIKFNALKGTLRRFSLIPASGGGLLTHAVARLASSLKIKEDDESGEGVESLITRVENLLVNGKLAEAADALEIGSRGSQAEEAVTQWVRQVRARAIAEQTLSLLQSYASSITFS